MYIIDIVYDRRWWVLYQTAPPLSSSGDTPTKNVADKVISRTKTKKNSFRKENVYTDKTWDTYIGTHAWDVMMCSYNPTQQPVLCYIYTKVGY